MARELLKRLERLEASNSQASSQRPVHRVVVAEDMDGQARIDVMIADGLAAANDHFIVRRIITGVPRSDTWGMATT
jgi:type IV secretory pathway TrbD component